MSMPYHIETWDDIERGHLRKELRQVHLAYVQQQAGIVLAAGAKLNDDGTDAGGGVYIVDVDTREEAERFIAGDPFQGNRRMIRKPPQEGHWLGTDGAGRDVWARVAYASRVSLSVGVVAVAISTVIGLVLGSLSGFLGGKIDSLIMRFTDILLSIPLILLLITAASLFKPGLSTTIIVIGLILVPLPGPGWLIVFVGLTVLGSEYHWARRFTSWLRMQLARFWAWWRARRERRAAAREVADRGVLGEERE